MNSSIRRSRSWASPSRAGSRRQLDRELRRLFAQVRARAAQLVLDGVGGVARIRSAAARASASRLARSASARSWAPARISAELALEVDELALPLRIALARGASSAAASSRSLRIACGARRRRSGSACA
jgi:hypothetical protein